MEYKNIIIDGGDLCGKTSVISILKLKYPKIQDRDKINICPLMLESVPFKERCLKLRNLLTTKLKDSIVIFMYNLDENELKRRCHLRENPDEYDQNAYFYNKMYKDAYDQLNDIPNLIGVDCTKLTTVLTAFKIIKEVDELL